MNNIFENAKFGDCFKTRDGRKAIYIQTYKTGEIRNELVVEDEETGRRFYLYKDNGSYYHKECDEDIVSEWTIDEKELDELAKSHAKKELGYTDSDISNFNSWNTVAQAKFREVCEDFKAGYRKARKEMTIKVCHALEKIVSKEVLKQLKELMEE